MDVTLAPPSYDGTVDDSNADLPVDGDQCCRVDRRRTAAGQATADTVAADRVRYLMIPSVYDIVRL